MSETTIAWTATVKPDGTVVPGYTFNSWWGCVKISPGCTHCYAEPWAKRTGFNVWGPNAPRRFFGDKHWYEPILWNKKAEKAGERRRVFCGSMCDWAEIHRDFEIAKQQDAARERLANLILATPHLDWMLLTKRIHNAAYMLPRLFPAGIPSNAWIGATVVNQAEADEIIPILVGLRKFGASVLFLSMEPMLEPINIKHWLYWGWINLVIVGGESGPYYRTFDPDRARPILAQCREHGVSFFMKQLGGHPDKRDKMEDLPEDLQVREFPK